MRVGPTKPIRNRLGRFSDYVEGESYGKEVQGN